MHQTIRKNTFETNSSSIHSLVIYGHTNKNLSDLEFTIDTNGEYGWSFERYSDCYSIIEYLYIAALTANRQDIIEKLKEWLPNCIFNEPKIDERYSSSNHVYYDINGYVDHSYEVPFNDIFESEDTLADLIFEGEIITGNDNSDFDDSYFDPSNAIRVFYKSN